jgi:hypothetical protein
MDFERYETDVVRLMYDYVSSVVWFPDPVPYEATGFSPELIAELRAWERLYEEGLDENQEWRSLRYLARIDRDRPGLAHRIGDELGSAFEVEFGVPHNVWFGPRHASYRSEREPTNPTAAAAFAAMADVHRERRESWRLQAEANARSGGSGTPGWYAVSPQSGRVFIPPDPEDPPRVR